MEENTNVTGAEETPSLVNDGKTEEPTTVVNQEEPKVETKTEEKPAGAPEVYEDFKLPEGVEKDAELFDKFLPLAKELGLTQDNAQKLVDLQAGYVANLAKAQQEVWTKQMETWATEAKNDKEIGGAKFNENIGIARQAVKQFGDDELRKAFDLTGIGNHPALIKFLYKVGKATSEDVVHKGGNNPGAQKSLTERLYQTNT